MTLLGRIEMWIVARLARYCARRNIGLLVNVEINSRGVAVFCPGRLVSYGAAIHVPITAPTTYRDSLMAALVEPRTIEDIDYAGSGR